MSSKKRSSKAAQDYESDGGFIANDNNDDDAAPKSKKVKTGKQKTPATSAKPSVAKESEFFELSEKRRITIDTFKGTTMVNIREYYEDKNSGNMLPGKKGIALSIAQYQTFVTLLPEIEAALLAKGETVPRPEYGAAAPAAAARAKDGEGDEVEAEVEGEGKEGKGEKRNGKRNFEATSDEEE